MNISSTLMLIIGITAGMLFLVVFIIASIITAHNRRIIQKHASLSKNESRHE